jgi:hypothetical protein
MLVLAFAALLHYDVLISAGHEGRPQSCARFPAHRCNVGTKGEREWTPIVADVAANVLRARGYTVAREPADFEGNYDVGGAIFIHFDGTTSPCSSGASIGYHSNASKPAAIAWRKAYRPVFPFRIEPDNFTDNLRDYYGFRQVRARRGALVLELGELTCPAQKRWLGEHLQWEGEFIANFLTRLLTND